MSLVASTATWTLSNLAFGIGDIVLLAGAGRKAITWVTANARDRSLLELLGLEEHTLDLRRGLVDSRVLDQRWSQRLRLMRNGRPVEIDLMKKAQKLESLNTFTWLMTVITAGLEASASNELLNNVLHGFLIHLVEDRGLPDAEQFAIASLHEHIQGWRSIACVRMMLDVARDIWVNLERQGRHPPGLIPDAEEIEIVRFLTWLSGRSNSPFRTASSDILCLSLLLQRLGFATIRTGTKEDFFHDGVAAIIHDKTSYLSFQQEINANKTRVGMHIPLDNLLEVVSLWPDSRPQRERRRRAFRRGAEAARGIRFIIDTFESSPQEPFKYVTMTDRDEPESAIPTMFDPEFANSINPDPESASPEIRDVMGTFFLCDRCPTLATHLSDLCNSHGLDVSQIQALPERVPDVLQGNKDFFADFQAFFLGYYYHALMPLLDYSMMSRPEGFGSWNWLDIEPFNLIKWFSREWSKVRTFHSNGLYRMAFSRSSILMLMAYFFAGAESGQLKIGRNESGLVGIVGKLVLLSASLLGNADHPERVSKFVLLDIDARAIASNELGVLYAAPEHSPITEAAKPLSSFQPLRKVEDGEDFTCHLEPAWNYDTNQCLLAYRHQGRLVHRVNVLDSERGVLRGHVESSPSFPSTDFLNVSGAQLIKNLCGMDPTTAELQSFGRFQASPQDFCGNRFYKSQAKHGITLIQCKGLASARACIAAIYSRRFPESPFLPWGRDHDWKMHFPDGILICIDEHELVVIL